MATKSNQLPATLDTSKSAIRERRLEAPDLIVRAGPSARFAWSEFFNAEIPNDNTRKAYLRAVKKFLRWCDAQHLELQTITPGHVGRYMQNLKGAISSKKQDLAGIRKFLDLCVVRHVIVFNPALSVRGEKYQVLEGKTPRISIEQARQLIASISKRTIIGRRDRAIIATWVYTAARPGAVSKLNIRDFVQVDKEWSLRFAEKGGKTPLIPARSDLEDELHAYLDATGLRHAPKNSPLFPTIYRRSGRLTNRRMSGVDMWRMMKRRALKAGLPSDLSPHSFRVGTLTDLFESGADPGEIQDLAGHADPRTTKLYDRRKEKAKRKLVKRISDLKLDRGDN